MALAACRECGQSVSTEAASCPHCGITGPGSQPAVVTAPPVSSRPTKQLIAGGAVVVILIVIGGGYALGKSQGWFPTGTLNSRQVEQAIAARYSQISGQTIDVACPKIPRQKGKINDCTATVAGTDRSTAVFVTQIDGGGHFTYSPQDASVLIASPAASAPDSAPAGPDLSAQDAAKQNDKGWVLEQYTAGGSGTINARIKNANAEASSAFFTMTLLNAGTVVATWHGSANSVEPGAVESVTMLTTDTVPTGVTADDMQFQTDTSIAG